MKLGVCICSLAERWSSVADILALWLERPLLGCNQRYSRPPEWVLGVLAVTIENIVASLHRLNVLGFTVECLYSMMEDLKIDEIRAATIDSFSNRVIYR